MALHKLRKGANDLMSAVAIGFCICLLIIMFSVTMVIVVWAFVMCCNMIEKNTRLRIRMKKRSANKTVDFVKSMDHDLHTISTLTENGKSIYDRIHAKE